MPDLSLVIANDFASLGPASARVRDFLDGCGAPMPASFLTDLVIEELVTNTIKYGYDDGGAHEIHVHVDYQDGHLRIEIRDDGHPFDPLSEKSPDLSLPAEERAIGGLGIHLVRQMTDEVRYERRGDENIITTIKTFPPEPPADN